MTTQLAKGFGSCSWVRVPCRLSMDYGLCVAGDRVAEDRGIRELLSVRREEEHLCVRAPRHRRQGRHVLAVEQESSSVAPRRRAAVGRRAAGSAAFERRSDPVERVGEASRLHLQPLLLASRSEHRRLASPLCRVDQGRLLSLRLKDGGPLLALCGHLHLHRRDDLWRGVDVAHLDARHVDAPAGRHGVGLLEQLLVEPLPRGKRLVEGELADLGAELREDEVRDAGAKVVHCVARAGQILYPEEDDGVGAEWRVVGRDARLRRHVEHLLSDARVDRHALDAGYDERQAGVQAPLEPPQPLHQSLLAGRDDAHR
mmetsp:Transcript_1926/g.6338  ORF Transcript_1926/g.6338 Transcript_1926/m.6338 type:complete len:314 (+) Transcript_1926:57-998(+)